MAKMLVTSCSQVREKKVDPSLYTLEASLPFEEFSNTYSSVAYKNGIVFSADKPTILKKNINAWTGDLALYSLQKDENGMWGAPEFLEGEING
jgi:hypothetical protein